VFNPHFSLQGGISPELVQKKLQISFAGFFCKPSSDTKSASSHTLQFQFCIDPAIWISEKLALELSKIQSDWDYIGPSLLPSRSSAADAGVFSNSAIGRPSSSAASAASLQLQLFSLLSFAAPITAPSSSPQQAYGKWLSSKLRAIMLTLTTVP
jgi:hypothetical protein